MHGFRIGRVFGIDIRIDWSWVFIVVLLTWNLSAVFSAWHQGWSFSASTGLALTASLLFFGCILLHELAHSAVAARFGMRVRSITLFLFGGVSDIEREPPSPKAELLMAIAGPFSSILLGLVFLFVASLTTTFSLGDERAAWTGLSRMGATETLLVWLGTMNLVIGAFNLMPAFPLDGGRVLRSILWGLSGDLQRSTRRVSFVGQGFGWLLILTGIAMIFGMRVPFFGTGFLGGMWLAFIGWFLQSAASQAHRRIAIEEALAGHVVSEVMRRGPKGVSPELPLATLVHEHFVRSDERAMPVLRDDALIGVVSIADVRAVPPLEWGMTTVAAVMQPLASVPTATPGEPLAEAFHEIAQRDVNQLPVLEDGRLVGVLQRRDVTRWLELAWGTQDGPGPRSRTAAWTAPTTPSRGARDPHPRSNLSRSWWAASTRPWGTSCSCSALGLGKEGDRALQDPGSDRVRGAQPGCVATLTAPTFSAHHSAPTSRLRASEKNAGSFPSKRCPANWKPQPTVNSVAASGRPTTVAPMGRLARIIGMPMRWHAWFFGSRCCSR